MHFKDVDGVTNTGTVAGKEIIQVYVHDHKAKLVRPRKELKGFAKVALQPGETKTVTIPLDFRAFAYYHPGYRQWITEDGKFDLLISASAADIRATLTVTLQSKLDLPSRLNRESTPRDWLEDRRGKIVFAPMFQQMTAQMMSAFGLSETGADEMGMNMMGFFLDTPLLSLLQFQEGALPMPATTIVDGLLQQVQNWA